MNPPAEMPSSVKRDARCDKAECPRCGYALSGTIAAWSETCPLDGTCSECGLVFEWARVLCPDRFPPLWSFEHARRQRMPWTALRTSFLVLRPKRLWSELSMTDRIRTRRLVLLAALWFAAPVLALSLLTIAGNGLYWWDIQRGQVSVWGTTANSIHAHWTQMNPTGGPLLWQMIVTGVLDPMEQVRLVHVGNGTTPVFLQLRDGAGHLLVALPAKIGQPLEWRWEPSWIITELTLWCAIITLLPVSFGLLPVSRAQRGIRSAHLVRIWLYSLGLSAWCVLLSVPLALLAAMVGHALGIIRVGGIVEPLSIFVFLPVLWFWWMRASGRHLKLPRPWLVSGLLLLVTCLFVLLSETVIALLWFSPF